MSTIMLMVWLQETQCKNATILGTERIRSLEYRFHYEKINRIYDGVEAETRKSQASFQII